MNCSVNPDKPFSHEEENVVSNDDETTSNNNNRLSQIDTLPRELTGVTINEVMESWPLQIRFSFGNEDRIIDLSIDTVIDSITGKLSPGDKVDITIESNTVQPGTYHVLSVRTHQISD